MVEENVTKIVCGGRLATALQKTFLRKNNRGHLISELYLGVFFLVYSHRICRKIRSNCSNELRLNINLTYTVLTASRGSASAAEQPSVRSTGSE